jgi:ribonuclease P protein component
MEEGRRFPRAVRIRKPDDIRRVLRTGDRTRTAHLDIFSTDAPVDLSRFGSVVGKQGHTAVERNRLRRRLREIARLEVLPRFAASGRNVDLLVRARGAAYDASYQALRDEVVRVTEGICSSERS